VDINKQTLRLSYSQSLGTTETATCYNMYLRTDLVQRLVMGK